MPYAFDQMATPRTNVQPYFLPGKLQSSMANWCGRATLRRPRLRVVDLVSSFATSPKRSVDCSWPCSPRSFACGASSNFRCPASSTIRTNPVWSGVVVGRHGTSLDPRSEHAALQTGHTIRLEDHHYALNADMLAGIDEHTLLGFYHISIVSYNYDRDVEMTLNANMASPKRTPFPGNKSPKENARRPATFTPTGANRESLGTRRCFRCNSADHLIRDCPKPELPPKTPTRRGFRGGQGKDCCGSTSRTVAKCQSRR
jgi:hypothetical protein